MKIKVSKYKSVCGSVLLVTMGVIAIAAIGIASYLLMVQNQTASVARSQSWNSSISVTEAGIEEGLALVNIGAPNIITSPWAWTNSVGSNGWSSFSGSQVSLTRYVSGSNYYTVTVDVSSGTPTVSSVGFVPLTTVPWVFSSTYTPFVAAGGITISNSTSQSQSQSLARKVQVQTVLDPLFSAAIITKSNFNMNGNNARVDSFDSNNPLYSTLGQYVTSLSKAGGDVATDSSIVGDVNIGNGNIYGHVKTGPGTAQNAVQVGSQGAVGDAAWNASSTGIESNYWSGDFNANINDVSPPSGGSPALPAAVGGVVTLNGGTYAVDAANSGLNNILNITAPTTLWVKGSFSPQGITIATNNNAQLILYVGAASGSGYGLDLGGNGTINQPGYAANMQIYGLPSLTSLRLHGNAGVVAGIYAPEADAAFGGGGNNTQDTSGAMVVNSITLNGHWNFHYDERLKITGPTRGWIAHSWTELKSQ